MPVRALRSERHHDAGLRPPEERDDSRNGGARIGAVEILILVIEYGDVAYAEDCRSAAQFPLAYGRQRGRTGMLGVTTRMAAVPAALTAGRGDQMDVDALRGIFRERSAK